MEPTQALETALAFERRVRDHYANCARVIQDPHGQKVFALLAREEQVHVEHLEARMEAWRNEGAVTPGEVPTLLPGLPGEPVKASGPSLAELDFLREALELERRTCTFYQELVSGLDPSHRALFHGFLETEEHHLAFVQAEIDALVGHGQWLDFQEARTED